MDTGTSVGLAESKTLCCGSCTAVVYVANAN